MLMARTAPQRSIHETGSQCTTECDDYDANVIGILFQRIRCGAHEWYGGDGEVVVDEIRRAVVVMLSFFMPAGNGHTRTPIGTE